MYIGFKNVYAGETVMKYPDPVLKVSVDCCVFYILRPLQCLCLIDGSLPSYGCDMCSTSNYKFLYLCNQESLHLNYLMAVSIWAHLQLKKKKKSK